MADRTQQEQASPAVQKRVRDNFDRQGLMIRLGARLAHVGPRRVHIAPPVCPEVSQQRDYVHAGATSAIADSAGGCAVLTLFPEDSEVLSAEYRINLPAPAVGDHIEAVGTVLRSGRTPTVCQVEAYGVQGDGERRRVANGQQTLMRVSRSAE
ncbi:PaaI family thioesterase [Streptomyces sp. NPDC020800]|uniref:PaaI family thioesterase n=1 Tax=Streptomyces sp. NPDC020800 TaxID=3365092 RepID=UPI0037A0DADA